MKTFILIAIAITLASCLTSKPEFKGSFRVINDNGIANFEVWGNDTVEIK